MPITLISRAPMEELLEAVARVLRDFRPPPLTGPGPRWVKATDGAPAGHWLLPAGTKIHLYNVPASVDPPAVVVYHTGDPVPMTDESLPCVHWEVPMAVDVYWPKQLLGKEVDKKLDALTAALTAPLPTGDADTATPWARLSDDQVHVFNAGLRQIRQSPMRADNGFPILRVSFTVRAGTVYQA